MSGTPPASHHREGGGVLDGTEWFNVGLCQVRPQPLTIEREGECWMGLSGLMLVCVRSVPSLSP